MTLHMLAFSESEAKAALGNIAAVSDPSNVFNIVGDEVHLQGPVRHVVGLMVGSPNISQARLGATSLLPQYPDGGPDISPLNVGAEPLIPLPWLDLRSDPIMLSERDRLTVKNANGNNAEDNWALVLLSDKAIAPAPGRWRPHRFTTAASALTAEGWSTRTLTATQTLPNGRYEVGGAFAVSPTGRAMRLSFSASGSPYRPGVVIGDSEADMPAPHIFRNGGLGVLGTFEHDTPPSVEFFADAADNEVQEVYLDIRKVA